MKFDPSKPFGRICGGTFHGAVYEQGGKYFSGSGEYLPNVPPAEEAAPEPEAEVAPAAPEPAPAPEPAAPAAPPPAPVLTIGKPAEPVDRAPIGQVIPIPDEAKVDLKAWRRGDIKLPWHIVVPAIQAHYSEKPTNMAHAHQIIDAG